MYGWVCEEGEVNIMGNKYDELLEMFLKFNDDEGRLNGKIADTNKDVSSLEKQILSLKKKVYEKEIKFVKEHVADFTEEGDGICKVFSYKDVRVSRKIIWIAATHIFTFQGEVIDSPEIANDLFNYIDRYQEYK